MYNYSSTEFDSNSASGDFFHIGRRKDTETAVEVSRPPAVVLFLVYVDYVP